MRSLATEIIGLLREIREGREGKGKAKGKAKGKGKGTTWGKLSRPRECHRCNNRTYLGRDYGCANPTCPLFREL